MRGAARLPARSDELLAAAERAFARRGYFGTSTAEVAAEMGVSQPYVMQAFRSKRNLFVLTHRFSGEKVLRAFRTGLADGGFDPSRVGSAYRELVLRQEPAVLVFAHAFSAAAGEPVIGLESRRLFGEIHRLLASSGATETEIAGFMGRGMLINTLLLMEGPHYAARHGFEPLTGLVLGS